MDSGERYRGAVQKKKKQQNHDGHKDYHGSLDYFSPVRILYLTDWYQSNYHLYSAETRFSCFCGQYKLNQKVDSDFCDICGRKYYFEFNTVF